jgi:hypothetical protein
MISGFISVLYQFFVAFIPQLFLLRFLLHLDQSRADCHASWHGACMIMLLSNGKVILIIIFCDLPSTMPPKSVVKKRRPARKNAKTIKKPGRRSNINPSLLPDTSQLGLREEYTEPPHSFDDLSAMIGEHEDGDEDEDEDGDWDGDGDGDEEEGEGEDKVYEDNGPSQEHNPGAPQHYQPLPQEHDLGAPQHYQPLPYYPDYAPFAQMSTDVATFDNLIPAAIRELEPITRSRFSGIERMRGDRLERQRTRCSAQAGINIPGIRRVFVYSPRRHPAETQRGQVITTGVIRVSPSIFVTCIIDVYIHV